MTTQITEKAKNDFLKCPKITKIMTYQQKKDAWTKKCLTAQAHTQPKETLPIGDFTNIIRVDRYFKVVMKWMEAYDLYNQANRFQIN